MQQYLEIGKIAAPHGINGEVKVIPLTDNPERYLDLDWVYIEKGTELNKHHISNVKFLKNTVIVKFKEINNRNEAELLRNFYLKIDRSNAVKLPKDSYFICDIVDCEVYDIKGAKIGVVYEVIETGSNDVYVVKRERGKDVLIPALKSVVKDISISEKKITVELPEGLIDDEI